MELARSRTGLLAGISALAVVFTVALTFATLQLPVILGNWLSRYFPDIHPVIEPERVAEFMAVARPVGYACLGVIAILIVAGFVTGKKKLSIVGSLAFFLPTFGYFLASMFFLAGLGILRVPFVPFWDPNVNLMNFGDISYVPYMVLVYPFWLGRIDIREILAWIAIGTGLFTFILGTITWFYGRAQRRKAVDFWIYRHSRHPQYLGFIIWSYGVMLFAAQEPVPMGGSNPGASLPWLLTSLLIIWIALAEEGKMRKEDSEAHLQYRAHAPFMFRVPSFVSAVLTLPIKLLLKKNRPETGRELVATFPFTRPCLSCCPLLLSSWTFLPASAGLTGQDSSLAFLGP